LLAFLLHAISAASSSFVIPTLLGTGADCGKMQWAVLPSLAAGNASSVARRLEDGESALPEKRAFGPV